MMVNVAAKSFLRAPRPSLPKFSTPRIEAGTARSRDSSKRWSPTRGGGLGRSEGDGAILLVEDQTIDAALVRHLLRKVSEHDEVQVVRTVDAAVRALPGDFTLILLDLGLPDGQGHEVFDRVNDAAAGIPIVVLTGIDDGALARQCIEGGAQDYVVKREIDEHTLGRSVAFARARDHAQRLRSRLQHADRLASVGQLAATVAHEVNNPATFIRLNTEDILRRVAEMEQLVIGQAETVEPLVLQVWLAQARTILADNLDGIERVIRLVRDLRLFSGTNGEEVEQVDVAQLCQSTLNIVSHHVLHRARLEVELGPVPRVCCDPRRLGQVVMNLVLNAAQAIDGPRDDNRVSLSTSTEAGEVCIAVSDTGGGITDEKMRRIFEPFYSTKTGAEGTGLGLAISLEIVQMLGGTMDVQSAPGAGSCFTVRIPVTGPAEAHRPTTPTMVAPSLTVSRCRVLLVDDEPQLLDAVGRGLARHHDVVVADGGARALSLLSSGEQFDVIVCDMMMPGIDGVAVIEHIRLHHPALADRVVVLSGGAATRRAADFLDETDLTVLVKPVSLRELNRTIQQTHEDALPSVPTSRQA
ncbi:MAG: response regulator [Deltaproteobacteria bacterium]|nr:response regulator [Deltaproteobacteria bacterium]